MLLEDAVLATWAIKSSHSLSFATALNLSDLKIGPIATYSIHIIWEDLRMEMFERKNHSKAFFSKKH